VIFHINGVTFYGIKVQEFWNYINYIYIFYCYLSFSSIFLLVLVQVRAKRLSMSTLLLFKLYCFFCIMYWNQNYFILRLLLYQITLKLLWQCYCYQNLSKIGYAVLLITHRSRSRLTDIFFFTLWVYFVHFIQSTLIISNWQHFSCPQNY
jgi:hypothetical protein